MIILFFCFSLLCCKGLVWCLFPLCATPEMPHVLACRMGMFGTSKVVLVIFLFSLISCTQGLSAFGLRNLKEGKNIKVSAMKLLFNLLRLIHIVLPSSRQPN